MFLRCSILSRTIASPIPHAHLQWGEGKGMKSPCLHSVLPAHLAKLKGTHWKMTIGHLSAPGGLSRSCLGAVLNF